MEGDVFMQSQSFVIRRVVALKSHLQYHHRPSYLPKSANRPYPLQLQPSLQQRILQTRRLLQEHLVEAHPFVAGRHFVLGVCEEVT